MIEHLTATLALIGIVVLVSSLLSGVVERSGVPQVAIFLLLGLILGPSGLNVVAFGLRSPSLHILATLGLVLVLFSDAIGLDIGDVRRNRRLAVLILGPGTILPAALMAFAAWGLLRLPVAAALVIGGSLASTDPVILRTLVRKPALPAPARLALRLESGMNDVVLLPVVVIAMLFMERVPTAGEAHRSLGGHLLGLFVLGPLLGALIGWIAIRLLESVRARVGVRRDYESLYALGVAFSAYAAAEAVGGSGFLAAFAAGAVIAVLDVELCDCFLDYGEATAEMFLLLTFVAFGAGLIWLGFEVADLRTVAFAIVALTIRTAVLMPVLRRAALDGTSRRLIAWFGPRGLSSLLLVLLPVFAGVAGSERLFAIVALVVLLSVVLHGGAIALFLRRHASRESASVAASTTPPPHAPSGISGDVADVPERLESADIPERIEIADVRAMMERGEPLVLVDARTERTWREDPYTAVGAVRMPPDDAVRTATQKRLEQRATLVVYCA